MATQPVIPSVLTHFAIKDPRFSSLVIEAWAPSTAATDANQTYTTNMVLGGMIVHTTVGAARTNTLPTGEQFRQSLPGIMVGQGFRFFINNQGANNITIAAGSGGATFGNVIVTPGVKEFLLVFTNVTPGSTNYTLYSLGESLA